MPRRQGDDNVVHDEVGLILLWASDNIHTANVTADSPQCHGQQAEGAGGIGHTHTHKERHGTDTSAT